MFCNSFDLEETNGLREQREAVLGYCKGIQQEERREEREGYLGREWRDREQCRSKD